MEHVSLRIATERDREFLFRLHREALGPYVDAIWGWEDAVQLEMFSERFEPPANQIVEREGEAVGCLRVFERAGEVHLDYIALMPAQQNRGIGSALVRDIQQRARARGVPVRLSVLRPNPARRLYERLGFCVVDQDEERIRMEWAPGGAAAQLGAAPDRSASPRGG